LDLPESWSHGFFGDFDGDGRQDLFLHGLYRMIFSFGHDDAVTMDLEIDQDLAVSPAPAWTASGPQTLWSTKDSISKAWSISPQRELLLLEELDFVGYPVELDGIAPPEIVHEIMDWTAFARTVRVLEKSNGSWSVARSFEGVAGMPGHAPVIANFDNKGGQEMILPSRAWLGIEIEELLELRLLSTSSTPSNATLSDLPSMNAGILWIKALPNTNGIGSRLLAMRATPPAADLFGNPVSILGAGSRLLVRNFPLSANNPQDWPLAGTPTPVRVSAATLDSDGLPDLVMLDDRHRLHVSTSSATGARSFIQPTAPQPQPVHDLMMMDLDNDGTDDPVLLGQARLRTWRTQPGPTLSFNSISEVTWYDKGSLPQSRLLGAGDFSGEGKPEPLFLRGTDETICWAEIGPSGGIGKVHPVALAGRFWSMPSFAPRYGYTWIDRSQTLIRDFDGNGTADFLRGCLKNAPCRVFNLY
jgi:hypothetical protein